MKDKITEFGSKLVKHELINGTFYMFIGSMTANVLAFLLNLFLARKLSYSDYAIFASVLSVITLASIPAGSLNTIIVKFATQYSAKGEKEKLKELYLAFFKFILGVVLFILILFTALAIPLSNYLKIDNIWYVIISGFAIGITYLSTLNMAFLQSLLKFGFISFLNSFSAVVRVFFGVTLAILGYRAFSGLWSILLMAFAAYFIAYVPLWKIIKTKTVRTEMKINWKEIFIYAGPAFFTVLFMTSFTSTDVILVKHFFNPHLAGYYAGMSLIGKAIFYFTGSIPTVMFPLLVKRHATGKNFNNLFYLALILVFVPSIAIAVFYSVFPNFVINLFLGGRQYLYIAKYLGFFGLYLTIFSLVNVCVNFFLSINRLKISVLVIASALMQIVLIYIYHGNFFQVISVSMLVLTLLLISLLYVYFRNYGKFGNIKNTKYLTG